MKIRAVHFCVALVSLFPATASAGILSSCYSVSGNLVVNCGFETGDFTGWTNTGNTSYTGVSTTYSFDNGSYAAYLGPMGSDGYLSQTITGAGALYQIQLAITDWNGGAPNDFTVYWNGVDIGPDLLNYGAPALGVISGIVSGNVGTNTLEFAYQQLPALWGLDDVSVVALSTGTATGLAFENLAGVPEPGTLGLMLAAGGLSGALMRRGKIKNQI